MASKSRALNDASESRAGSQGQVGQTTQDCPKPCNKRTCPKEPTKAQYKKLRRKSPSRKLRKIVNRKKPTICAACVKKVPKLEPDHIVSLKAISQMPGFACLSKADQKDVANTPDNFAGLCRSCNGSKQEKSWYEWKGVADKPPVSPDIRKSFKAKEGRRKEMLQAKINGKKCEQK